MSKHKDRIKNQKATAWRNLEGVIWMVGLAILAIKGWWWPGIMVLVAISAVYESVLTMIFPDLEPEVPVPPIPPVAPAAPIPPTPTGYTTDASPQPDFTPKYQINLLPTNCPRCGAPARGHDVHWTSEHSADCGFCGASLPLGKK